jgi:hypothetical protein
MTDAVEIAWLAGIFEGEGSVGTSWPTRTNRPYVQARIGMTDLDVLEHVQRVAGGRLKGPYTRNRRKPMYHWNLNGWDEVERLRDLIYPWLSARRREQFDRSLGARPTAAYDPGARGRAMTHCKRGHEFTPENTFVTVWRGKSMRRCLACHRIHNARQRAAKRAAKEIIR